MLNKKQIHTIWHFYFHLLKKIIFYMIKELIQKIFIFFGYKIINLKKDKSNLDQYLKTLINYNPLIFDVGANNGQSVENFKKIYPEAKFHCFEPNPDVWNILDKNYKDNKNVVTNIIAVSDQIGTNKFHIYANSKHSSFNKLIPNHQYTKERSKTFNLKESEYLKKIVDVKTITLDKYCEENNVNHIDILKIDTEGHDEKVLAGAKNLIKENKISIIKVELRFSEVYEKYSLDIYDIEKHITPYGYKLFGNNAYGNFYSDYTWLSDHLYISKDIYNNIKKNKSFKSFAD